MSRLTQSTASRLPSDPDQSDCQDGVVNLVHRCMGVSTGQKVLLVAEPQEAVFYDKQVETLIAQVLNEMGATVAVLRPAVVSTKADLPDDLISAMGDADHTLFLSRVGDYLRFTPMMEGKQVTICYARQRSMLASRFARVSHTIMTALLSKLEGELDRASRWRITCPLGTDIQGTFEWPSQRGEVDEDFSMNLFPVTTFKPVPGHSASGTVALSRWLMPGAAVRVEPAIVSFDGPVLARVDNGLLTGLGGKQDEVRQVEGYIDRVCSTLGIEQRNVHSWHIGVNPFTAYDGDVSEDLEGWGSISFGSPRYLHFHTTGNVPPGEIAWSIFNPTVTIDDVPFWQAGQFCWLQRADNRSIIEAARGGHHLLDESADIGI